MNDDIKQDIINISSNSCYFLKYMTPHRYLRIFGLICYKLSERYSYIH